MALDKAKLLALKEDIETAKEEVSKLTGKKEHLMGQLKELYFCSTIKEAEAKVQEYTKKISKLDRQISEGTVELEEKYNINKNTDDSD